MTIECDITPDDLLAFNLYHLSHSPVVRRQYMRTWFFPAFVWLMICTAIWYLADRERGEPLQTFLALLPLFGGVPLYLIMFPLMQRRRLRKTITAMFEEGSNRALMSHHTIEISSDAISDSTGLSKTKMAWQGVDRIVRHDDYAFVYLNALEAVIIPRRAFADAARFDEFVMAADRYHQNARG